jgi:hypothetical protein
MPSVSKIAVEPLLLSWSALPRRTRSHRAVAITRSGTGVDLPGFGRGRSDMSDHEDAPAARGGFGGRARRNVDRDDDHSRPWRRSDFPSDDALFARCRVKVHEDIPRHIHRLFLVLGIQPHPSTFRLILNAATLSAASPTLLFSDC